MKLSQICSPYLRDYLVHTFGDVILEEKSATCGDCLCSKKLREDLPFYQAHLKCCTFQPFLPNYAVGAVLSDPQIPERIRNPVLGSISNLEYALPLGIFVPVSYQVAYNQREAEDFGNREEFLCSYFDRLNNQCGIWLYRGAVCTSYFCTSDYGKSGLDFWTVLGDYLHVCEMVLSQDCQVAMGLPPERIDGQLEYINCESGTSEELLSRSMHPALFKEFWKDWDSSPEEFYLSCARYLKNLDLKNFRELLEEETYELKVELQKRLSGLFIHKPG